MRRPLTRTGRSPLPAFLVVLLVILAVPAAPSETYVPGTLHELNSVEQLGALFQQERGRPRLVLLLSPT